MTTQPSAALEKVRSLLQRSESDPRQVVVMTCGIAGSGKSTLSKAIVAEFPSYERLSIDGFLHEKYGIYRVDYSPEKYEEYQDDADDELQRRLASLLEDGKRDIVLDRSLYAKEDRDYYKRMIEAKGARWVLVFFRPASKELIWRRIVQRRENGVNADSAFEITKDILNGYWDGFENPEGEGEIVIDVN
ncbi:P-loop containing nucleoside triphosphate hydrolase protein [Thozetella sp. PMI_491]|nr:P-loop containing nucleoside triphosphate hydrolase protein [Thozetella sp. PMI_491]